MKKIALLVLICIYAVRGICQEKLKVTVHPGVELLTIVQILAEKYPQPTPSRYSKEALEYFGKYKDHPAVKKVMALKKVFSDLPELGWCLNDFPNIKIYEPANDLNWYKLNGREEIISYLNLCKDFFYDTKFWEFYSQHIDRYTAWGNHLKVQVDSAQLIPKLQDFYKYNSDVQWYICIDPLNNWGSHAIMTKTLAPQFANVVAYNTGYFGSTATTVDTDPIWQAKNFENLVWHEGSHVYIEPLFKKYKQQIDALEYLFNKEDGGMKSNNISNWEYCLNENMVRAITACLYKQYRSERAFKKQLAKETMSDFIYVDDLCGFIYDGYVQSGKYKNFEEFFPKVLTFLSKKYPKKP